MMKKKKSNKRNRYNKNNYKKVAQNYRTQKYQEGSEAITRTYDAARSEEVNKDTVFEIAKDVGTALSPAVVMGIQDADMSTSIGADIHAATQAGKEVMDVFADIGTLGLAGMGQDKVNEAIQGVGGQFGGMGQMAKHGGHITKYQQGTAARAQALNRQEMERFGKSKQFARTTPVTEQERANAMLNANSDASRLMNSLGGLDSSATDLDSYFTDQSNLDANTMQFKTVDPNMIESEGSEPNMQSDEDRLRSQLLDFMYGGKVPKYNFGSMVSGIMGGGSGGGIMDMFGGMTGGGAGGDAGGAGGAGGGFMNSGAFMDSVGTFAKGTVGGTKDMIGNQAKILAAAPEFIGSAGAQKATARGAKDEQMWGLDTDMTRSRAQSDMGLGVNPGDGLKVVNSEGQVSENAMRPGLMQDIQQRKSKILGEQTSDATQIADSIGAVAQMGNAMHDQFTGKVWGDISNATGVVKEGAKMYGDVMTGGMVSTASGMMGAKYGGEIPSYQQGAEVREEGMNEFRLTPHFQKEISRAKGQDNGVMPVTDQNAEGVADLSQQDGVYDLQGERHASPQDPNAEGIKTNAPAEGQGPSMIETEDGELAVVNQGETFIIPRSKRNEYLKLHNKREKIQEKLNDPAEVDMNPIMKNTLTQVVSNIGKQEMALFNKIKEEKAAKEMKETQELTEMIKQGVPITPEGDYKKGGKVKSLSDYQKKQLSENYSETYNIDLSEGMDSYQSGDAVSPRMQKIADQNIAKRRADLAEEKRLKQERKDQRKLEIQKRRDERTVSKNLRKERNLIEKDFKDFEKSVKKNEREEWKNLSPEQRKGRKEEEKYADREARNFDKWKNRTSKDMQKEVRREEREIERLEKIRKRNPERADRVAERMNERENRRLEREFGPDEAPIEEPKEKTPEEQQKLKDMLGKVGGALSENADRYNEFDYSETDNAVDRALRENQELNEENYEGTRNRLFQQNLVNKPIRTLEEARERSAQTTEANKERLAAQAAASRRSTTGDMQSRHARARALQDATTTGMIKLDQAGNADDMAYATQIAGLEGKGQLLASEGQQGYDDRNLRDRDNFYTQSSKNLSNAAEFEQWKGQRKANENRNSVLANALPDAIDPNDGTITMGQKPGSTTPSSIDIDTGGLAATDPGYYKAIYDKLPADYRNRLKISKEGGPIENLADKGRFGDTELAHVNKFEKALLESMGGSGSINPETGLREYFMNMISGLLGGGGGGGMLGGLMGGGGKEGGGGLGGMFGMRYGGQVPRYQAGTGVAPNFTMSEPVIPQDPNTIPQGGYSKPDGTSIGLDGQVDPMGTMMNNNPQLAKFSQTQVGGFMADNPELVQGIGDGIQGLTKGFSESMKKEVDWKQKAADEHGVFAKSNGLSNITDSLGITGGMKAEHDRYKMQREQLGNPRI